MYAKPFTVFRNNIDHCPFCTGHKLKNNFSGCISLNVGILIAYK